MISFQWMLIHSRMAMVWVFIYMYISIIYFQLIKLLFHFGRWGSSSTSQSRLSTSASFPNRAWLARLDHHPDRNGMADVERTSTTNIVTLLCNSKLIRWQENVPKGRKGLTFKYSLHGEIVNVFWHDPGQ
jgi:hypothetical protein